MPLSPSVFPVRHFLTLYFYNLLSKNTQAIEKNVRWKAKTSLPGMDAFSKNYHERKVFIMKQKEHFYIFRLLLSNLHKTHKTTTILLQCLHLYFYEKLFSYLV
jgi:hypothetical protein